MPISVFPPQAAGTALVSTKGQVTTGIGGPKDLTSIDPNLDASNIVVNTMFAAAHGGAEFTATVVANNTRLAFERKPFGSAGWVPTAALDPSNGAWDVEHRVSDSGGVKSFLVPALGATDLRMRRTSGASLAVGTCVANALASHTGFPSVPEYVGKRDVVLMVDDFLVNPFATGLGLVSFTVMQENDDRTRTLSASSANRFVRTGRRLHLHSWDATYNPGAAGDRCRVMLVSRVDGAVNTVSNQKHQWTLNSAAGRAGVWSRPLEFQASLGANQMSVGVIAVATTATPGRLTLTLTGFETL